MRLFIDSTIENIEHYISTFATWFVYLFKTVSFDTFIVAGIGAFAGAIGAQIIAERTRKKREIVTDIRSINVAIMAATSIFNSSVALKKKHIKPIKENYDKQRKEFLAHMKLLEEKNHDEVPVFQFTADFQTLATLICPIEVLQNYVFEKSTVDNRLLMITSALVGVFNSLDNVIENRNDFISEMKTNKPDQQTLGCLYFGYRFPSGGIDKNYPSYINSMSVLCDDCIFFSNFLINELHNYGMRLKKQYGFNAPKVNKIDFNKFLNSDLMPNEEDYKQWIEMESKDRKWYTRLAHKVRSIFKKKL